MIQKTKMFRRFAIFRTIFSTLTIVAGVAGVATHTSSDGAARAYAEAPRQTVQDTKAFSSPEIGIRFTYPKSWKLVRENSEQIYTYRLYSPDYATTKDFIGNTTGHSGTIISIVSPRQQATLKDTKTHAADPAHLPVSSQFKDFQHAGRDAFSFTTEAYGGLGRSLTTELSIPNGYLAKISIQFNEKNTGNDDSYETIYRSLIDSVNYLL